MSEAVQPPGLTECLALAAGSAAAGTAKLVGVSILATPHGDRGRRPSGSPPPEPGPTRTWDVLSSAPMASAGASFSSSIVMGTDPAGGTTSRAARG